MSYRTTFLRIVAQVIKLENESASDTWRDARRIVSGQLDARRFAEKIERRLPEALHHRSPWGGMPATYFMRMEVPMRKKPIKIGWSCDPEARRLDMLTGSPYAITLLATFPECLLPEDELHRRYAAFRIRGEWFKANRGLTQIIGEVQAISAPTSWQPKASPDRTQNVPAAVNPQNEECNINPINHLARASGRD